MAFSFFSTFSVKVTRYPEPEPEPQCAPVDLMFGPGAAVWLFGWLAWQLPSCGSEFSLSDFPLLSLFGSGDWGRQVGGTSLGAWMLAVVRWFVRPSPRNPTLSSLS